MTHHVDPNIRAAFLSGAEWARNYVLGLTVTIDATGGEAGVQLAATAIASLKDHLRGWDLSRALDVGLVLATAEDAAGEVRT